MNCSLISRLFATVPTVRDERCIIYLAIFILYRAGRFSTASLTDLQATYIIRATKVTTHKQRAGQTSQSTSATKYIARQDETRQRRHYVRRHLPTSRLFPCRTLAAEKNDKTRRRTIVSRHRCSSRFIVEWYSYGDFQCGISTISKRRLAIYHIHVFAFRSVQ